MHVSRPLLAPFALLASAAFSLTAGSASAGQSCTVDSDCAHGFDCEVVGGTACATPACAPGVACPPAPPCEAQVIKECVPGTCMAHSDCADGMVCYAIPSTTCASPPRAAACPPNTKCDPPADTPPDCTTTTTNRCVPRYDLPCTTDASCGDGFSCVPDPDSCACSGGGVVTSGGGSAGSSGSAAVDAGAGKPTPVPTSTTPPTPDPVPPQGCSCTPSTTNHCTPKATTCAADSDCPATWTCETINAGVACGGAAESLPDGGTKFIMDTCPPPPPPTHQCEAPNYGGSYGAALSASTSASKGTTGSVAPTAGAPAPDGTPVEGAPGSTSGVAGSGNDGVPRGTTGSAGSAAASDNDSANSGSGSSSSDNGGCQMSAGQADTTGASLLALLGVAGLIRRRRTRWG
ncbi:MAG TPA: MYXO-CTERM sorting domain-containing protein [Polyangiaceae bacterium]|nr:MYXO-CTERM sorting domain-containing protein [Polyangiaceae bacterium]